MHYYRNIIFFKILIIDNGGEKNKKESSCEDFNKCKKEHEGKETEIKKCKKESSNIMYWWRHGNIHVY